MDYYEVTTLVLVMHEDTWGQTINALLTQQTMLQALMASERNAQASPKYPNLFGAMVLPSERNAQLVWCYPP